MVRIANITVEDPSFVIIKSGDVHKVRAAINKGMNVNKMRWSGWTLLHRAAELGFTEICAVLIDHGAEVNGRTGRGWYSPLHICMGNGWMDTAEFLVSRGGNLNGLSKEGDNPFEYAFKRGYKDLAVQFRDSLIARGIIDPVTE